MVKPYDIRPLMDHEVQGTLADCLIDCADDLRQLYTEFGVRPYRVKLVWIQWTADEDQDGMLQGDELCLEHERVGVGLPTLVKEHELLPTPLLSVAGVGKRADPTGWTEAGNISISQISMGYTEDFLMGFLPDFRDPSHPETLRPGLEFFWEVQEDRPAGYAVHGTAGCEAPSDGRSVRRRFHVNGTPTREVDRFEWVVGLVRADGERDRDGDVEALR